MSFAPPSGPPPSSYAPPPGGFIPPPSPNAFPQALPPPSPAGFGLSPSMPTVGLPPSPSMPVAQSLPNTMITYLGTPLYRQAATAISGYDVGGDVEDIRKLKGDKLIEKLAKILPKRSAIQIQVLGAAYAAQSKTHEPLYKAIEAACGGTIDGFEQAVVLLAKGPLEGDAWLLMLNEEKLSGELEKRLAFYTDLLIARPDHEIATLREYLKATRHIDLDAHIQSQLETMMLTPSQKTTLQDVFKIGLRAKPETEDLEKDLKALVEIFDPTNRDADSHNKLIKLVIGRTPEHLKHLAHAFGARPESFGTTLLQALQTYFTNKNKPLLESILTYAVANASGDYGIEGAAVAADRIYLTMKGRGTRESLLSSRIVRAHWSPARFRSIIQVYERQRHHSLVKDMKEDLTGFFASSSDKNLYETLQAIVDNT